MIVALFAILVAIALAFIAVSFWTESPAFAAAGAAIFLVTVFMLVSEGVTGLPIAVNDGLAVILGLLTVYIFISAGSGG